MLVAVRLLVLGRSPLVVAVDQAAILLAQQPVAALLPVFGRAMPVQPHPRPEALVLVAVVLVFHPVLARPVAVSLLRMRRATGLWVAALAVSAAFPPTRLVAADWPETARTKTRATVQKSPLVTSQAALAAVVADRVLLTLVALAATDRHPVVAVVAVVRLALRKVAMAALAAMVA